MSSLPAGCAHSTIPGAVETEAEALRDALASEIDRLGIVATDEQFEDLAQWIESVMSRSFEDGRADEAYARDVSVDTSN